MNGPSYCQPPTSLRYSTRSMSPRQRSSPTNWCHPSETRSTWWEAPLSAQTIPCSPLTTRRQPTLLAETSWNLRSTPALFLLSTASSSSKNLSWTHGPSDSDACLRPLPAPLPFSSSLVPSLSSSCAPRLSCKKYRVSLGTLTSSSSSFSSFFATSPAFVCSSPSSPSPRVLPFSPLGPRSSSRRWLLRTLPFPPYPPSLDALDASEPEAKASCSSLSPSPSCLRGGLRTGGRASMLPVYLWGVRSTEQCATEQRNA